MRSPPARARAEYVFKDRKPSARGCEARLRGRERSMYSKTISRGVDRRRGGAGRHAAPADRGAAPGRPRAAAWSARAGARGCGGGRGGLGCCAGAWQPWPRWSGRYPRHAHPPATAARSSHRVCAPAVGRQAPGRWCAMERIPLDITATM